MFNIDFLSRIASKSDYKNKHVSLIIKGGAILSFACNHGGTHAEIRALNKLWPNRREGTTMVNLRLNHSMQVSLSRPCLECYGAMSKAGVKKVYYTTNEGRFEMERL